MKKRFIIFLILVLVLALLVHPAWAKSYWLEGGGIGAGVFGLGTGITAFVACSPLEHNAKSESINKRDNGWAGCRETLVPLGTVTGGAVGFGLGALVGMAFKKKVPVVQAIVDPVTGTYGASVGMEF